MINYMILAHADTKQLRLLVDTLAADSRSAIYLHMDARTPAPPWIGQPAYAGRVTLVPAIRVNWAGFSMVEATLRLLRTATDRSTHTRFVLLSGSCFPIRGMARINDVLLADEANHVALWKRVVGPGASPTPREAAAAGKLHLTDIGPLNPSRGKLRRVLARAFDWLNARLPYRVGASEDVVVKGSQWFAIDRALALEFLRAGARLRRRFRFSFAPDEMVFQTIYWNRCEREGAPVEFVDQASSRQGIHFILFRPARSGRSLGERITQTPDERRLDLDDLPAILASDALFARKCPLPLCEALLEASGTEPRCPPADISSVRATGVRRPSGSSNA